MSGEHSAPSQEVRPSGEPEQPEPGPTVALAPEPEYPPPDSVPRPPPPASLKVYASPLIHDVSPAHGSVLGETRVALSGANLFRVTIVRIGGVIAPTIGADEPRGLRVLTPSAERPGEVDITLENPFAPPLVLPKAFRYEPLAAPKIVTVAPHQVATKGATELTLTGEGFVKTTLVLLNGEPARDARFVSPMAIDVTLPPGEDGKMVDVSVKNPDGQTATVRRAFMYDKRFG